MGPAWARTSPVLRLRKLSLLQRNSLLSGRMPAPARVLPEFLQRILLEHVHKRRRSHYLLRLDDWKLQSVHLPREHWVLLGADVYSGMLGPAYGTVVFGSPQWVGEGLLIALFLLSCAVIALAQQTLP